MSLVRSRRRMRLTLGECSRRRAGGLTAMTAAAKPTRARTESHKIRHRRPPGSLNEPESPHGHLGGGRLPRSLADPELLSTAAPASG